MKKKTESQSAKKKKEYKLDLWAMLAAADAKNRKFFEKLDDEQVKEFNAYLPQRLLTSLEHDREALTEYLIRSAALNSNKNLGDLGKEHKELQYLLLTTISPDPMRGPRRKLIKPMRRITGSEKKINALCQIYPAAKISDLELMLQLMTPKEFLQLLEDHGINYKDD